MNDLENTEKIPVMDEKKTSKKIPKAEVAVLDIRENMDSPKNTCPIKTP